MSTVPNEPAPSPAPAAAPPAAKPENQQTQVKDTTANEANEANNVETKEPQKEQVEEKKEAPAENVHEEPSTENEEVQANQHQMKTLEETA